MVLHRRGDARPQRSRHTAQRPDPALLLTRRLVPMVPGFAPARHPFLISKGSLSGDGAGGVRVRLLRLTFRAADRPVSPKMTQTLSLVETDLSIAEGGNGHPLAFLQVSYVCSFPRNGGAKL